MTTTDNDDDEDDTTAATVVVVVVLVVVVVVVVIPRCEWDRARRDIGPDVNQSCRIARSNVRRTVSIAAARAESDECQRSASIARQGDVRDKYSRYGNIAMNPAV